MADFFDEALEFVTISNIIQRKKDNSAVEDFADEPDEADDNFAEEEPDESVDDFDAEFDELDDMLEDFDDDEDDDEDEDLFDFSFFDIP